MQMRAMITALVLASAVGTANADPAEWTVASGGNGHFYEFVSGDFTWSEAVTGAASRSFGGFTGYLATITSDAENTFISTMVSGNLGWVGGSDDGDESHWTWRTGPEAGSAFDYTHWNGGEPNNCCDGENYLQLNWSVTGGWNDHGGPGNASQKNGYFVEYGAPPVPEPETWALLFAGLGIVGAATARGRRTPG